MKIVHITQFFHPQKGYQENQFAKHHAQQSNETYIICSKYSKYWGKITETQMALWDKDFEKNTGVKVIRLKTLSYTIANRVVTFGLSKELSKIKPDCVYVHSLSSIQTLISSFWLNQNRKKKYIKTIIDDHMVYVASENRFSTLFYKTYSLFFVRFFIKTFDKWIAVSEETKDFILEKFSRKLTDKIEVIPLGVDIKLFRYDSTYRENFRNKYNIDYATKLLVYTGKRDNFKNPLILAKVLALLVEQNHDYKLVFVGENVNSYDSQIIDFLDKNKSLSDRIILLPSVKNTELVTVYSAADLAIWPNASSMSMLEAMACKCPVIASDMKVNKERLGNGRGLLFENGSIESLLRQILLIESLRTEVIENAYSWVTKYDWEYLAINSIK